MTLRPRTNRPKPDERDRVREIVHAMNAFLAREEQRLDARDRLRTEIAKLDKERTMTTRDQGPRDLTTDQARRIASLAIDLDRLEREAAPFEVDGFANIGGNAQGKAIAREARTRRDQARLALADAILALEK